jgi:hypothetical protein
VLGVPTRRQRLGTLVVRRLSPTVGGPVICLDPRGLRNFRLGASVGGLQVDTRSMDASRVSSAPVRANPVEGKERDVSNRYETDSSPGEPANPETALLHLAAQAVREQWTS